MQRGLDHVVLLVEAQVEHDVGHVLRGPDVQLWARDHRLEDLDCVGVWVCRWVWVCGCVGV